MGNTSCKSNSDAIVLGTYGFCGKGESLIISARQNINVSQTSKIDQNILEKSSSFTMHLKDYNIELKIGYKLIIIIVGIHIKVEDILIYLIIKIIYIIFLKIIHNKYYFVVFMMDMVQMVILLVYLLYLFILNRIIVHLIIIIFLNNYYLKENL